MISSSTYNEGETLAKKEGMLFFETSAKTGEGVVNMFYSSFATIDFFVGGVGANHIFYWAPTEPCRKEKRGNKVPLAFNRYNY